MIQMLAGQQQQLQDPLFQQNLQLQESQLAEDMRRLNPLSVDFFLKEQELVKIRELRNAQQLINKNPSLYAEKPEQPPLQPIQIPSGALTVPTGSALTVPTGSAQSVQPQFMQLSAGDLRPKKRKKKKPRIVVIESSSSSAASSEQEEEKQPASVRPFPRAEQPPKQVVFQQAQIPPQIRYVQRNDTGTQRDATTPQQPYYPPIYPSTQRSIAVQAEIEDKAELPKAEQTGSSFHSTGGNAP